MNDFPWQPSPPLTIEHPRPRVTAEIFAALSHPLVLILAAAGYGKTVAARSVWQAVEGNKAWWTVRAVDQTPEHGVKQLVSAARYGWGVPASEDPSLGALLGDLARAQGGLLIIDDSSSWPNPALWGAIGQLVAAMPAPCRLLLLCRYSPPLPVMLWRSQGRLALLDHNLLALTPEEWQNAGFAGGEAACEAACGWWGAEVAASTSNHSSWNPALAAWIHEAWFAPLPKEQQTLLGMASLLPELTVDSLCALSGQSAPMVYSTWADIAALSGPLLVNDDRIALAPRYRLYVSQAWRRTDTESWASTISRGVSRLLEQGDAVVATTLAYESGLPEQQQLVLESAGWTLLYQTHRPVLEPLLKQSFSNPNPATTLLQLAWQIEVQRLPHRADASLVALCETLVGHQRACALALLASIGWQYDDFERAETNARAALELFSNDLHPAYTLALMLLGGTLIIKGNLSEAEPLLRRAQAYAARDGLPYLQLDVLQRRALLASENGDVGVAMTLAQETHTLAERYQLNATGVVDSSARLIAWLHLQKLELAAAEQALNYGPFAAEPLAQRLNFPHRWFSSVLSLAADDVNTAQTQVEWISHYLSQQFCPHKWQNEASIVQLWLAARNLDRPRLMQLEQQLAQYKWPASLHTDRRRVMLAAARILADIADDATELKTLQQQLRQQGANTLAHQLELIILLQHQPVDRHGLLQHLRSSAANNQAFDYLWLGNKTIGPLEKLLTAPELIHDSLTLNFLRDIVQRLLSPAPIQNDTDTTVETPPPAGLTSKEWQILQLIGQQHTNDQIAAKLFVSLATVKTHINHIYSKLDIKTRAEAVHRARSL